MRRVVRLRCLRELEQVFLGSALGEALSPRPKFWTLSLGHSLFQPRSGLGTIQRLPSSAHTGCSCASLYLGSQRGGTLFPLFSPLSSHKPGLGMQVSVCWCPHPVDFPLRIRRA